MLTECYVSAYNVWPSGRRFHGSERDRSMLKNSAAISHRPLRLPVVSAQAAGCATAAGLAMFGTYTR